MPRLNHSDLLETAFRYFRSRRMRLFEQTFAITENTRVLDVGGSSHIWEYARVKPHLTLINLATAVEPHRPGLVQVAGDGCLLPFRDKSFDIVFSNSVIEHVGSPEKQSRFASEVIRVGQGYWVQTPNRRAPFEMHTMLPFVHRLPKQWQRNVITRFSPWVLLAKPTDQQRAYFFDHVLNDLKLLDASELRQFFQGAHVVDERVLGIPKSLIAFSTG